MIRIDGVIKDVFEFETLKRKDFAASHKMLEDFHDCNYRERLELIKKLLKDFTAFG